MTKQLYEYPSNIKLILSGGGGVINEQYTPNKIGDYPNATFTKDIIIPENTLYEDITHNIGLYINDVESGYAHDIIVGKAKVPIPTDCVMFTSDTDMIISPRYYTKSGQGYIDYSIDKINWFRSTNTESAKTIYMRGNGLVDGLFTDYTGNMFNWNFYNATNLKVRGTLTSLISYGSPPNSVNGKFAFREMFRDCTSLIDISELKMPGGGTYAFYAMFKGCTSLTEIPPGFLPGTSSSNYTYGQMFYDCTSLTTIPSDLLPLNNLLPSYACSQMFYNCTSLVINKESSPGYSRSFRIPSTGSIFLGAGSNALDNMFTNTAGTMNGTPEVYTTYYTKD